MIAPALPANRRVSAHRAELCRLWAAAVIPGAAYHQRADRCLSRNHFPQAYPVHSPQVRKTQSAPLKARTLKQALPQKVFFSYSYQYPIQELSRAKHRYLNEHSPRQTDTLPISNAKSRATAFIFSGTPSYNILGCKAEQFKLGTFVLFHISSPFIILIPAARDSAQPIFASG